MGYTSSSSATDWASFWYSLGFETTSGSPSFTYTIRKKKSENKNLPPIKNQINFFLRQIYLRTILSKSSQQIPAWLSNMAPVS